MKIYFSLFLILFSFHAFSQQRGGVAGQGQSGRENKGKLSLSEKLCNTFAIKLLPVPDSPDTNTGKSEFMRPATNL